jgi:L-serine/L-threonine ammonia-lyase
MAPLHINTPLLKSERLSGAGREVWLKLEALQPAGSFKNRGIGYACQHYVSTGASRLVSSSGGNAGIATAYCGHRLGVDVSVVVPDNAVLTAINAIKQFGASVIIHGSSWQEAHNHALSLVDGSAKLIHPFDDPLLWPGHATLVDEVVEAGFRPDAVVISVGGGGLLCGITLGLETNGLADVDVVAVETEGAASLNAAISAGAPVELENITTIANTLGAKQVSRAAFEATRTFNVTSHIVSDRDALTSCQRFLDDHRILVEPACGAALSAVYDMPELLNGKQRILVVVCGGMGVSMKQLEQWDAVLES